MKPEDIVQTQLDAYNAKNIDALLATYAPDAEHFVLHGALLAKGHEQLRTRFLLRFAESDLHAKLLSRTVFGNFVMDLEVVTRNFASGRGSVELLCVYEIANNCIIRASFASGPEQYE
jgi:hypothetical protein